VTAPAPLPAANYFDLHVAPGSTYTGLNVTICNGGNIVYWWDASATTWRPVSPQQLDAQSGCVTMTLTPQSSPSMTQLAGTPLAVMTDRTPPVTTAALTGKSGKLGWYIGPVTLTLTASDDLAGVRSTSYSTDGGTTWEAYSSPVTFAQDGSYSVRFRSTDRVGNVESARSLSFSIDQMAPTITCSATPDVLWPPDGKPAAVSVTCHVDDGGSGPAGFVLSSIRSNEGNIATEQSGFVVGEASTRGTLLADRSGTGTGRVYTLAYTGSDRAGNTARTRVTVTVPRDQPNPARP
jgi:hypothetical protein